MRARLDAFLKGQGNREEARAIVAAERREIAICETCKAHFSDDVYVATRNGCEMGESGKPLMPTPPADITVEKLGPPRRLS